MSPGAPALEMRGIEKDYFGTPVLKGVDLRLEKGKIHALLGENGAGKSTLMNILFGMPVIHSTGGFRGTILVDGKELDISTPQAAMGQGIGMVHQEFMLIPGFSIYENVKLNRERLRPSPVHRLIGRSLDLLDIPAMKADSRKAMDRIHLPVDETTVVATLPVGHMQFVEIAREVDKTDLRVLVFDEPTAVLTESEAETLLTVMRELADDGVAILFITHRLDEVMREADTVTILRDGERIACKPKTETSIEQIAELMVGRDLTADDLDKSASGVEAVSEDDSAGSAEVALEMKGFEVDMPGEAVRGIDLQLHKGEILGIGGLAGHGKVGIANGLMGLYPVQGVVEVYGKPFREHSAKEALRAGLAFVSEDRRGVGLLLDESIAMNIAIPAIEVHGKFLKAPWLGPLAFVDQAAVTDHGNSMIEHLDIRTTGPHQIVRRLSGGNQQKVCLARALVLDPTILLVSEPTRGIDVGAKKLVLDRLVQLNREQGLTILMTSSELGELRSICHRIAIISEGMLAGVLPADAPDVKFGLLLGGAAA